MRIYFLLIKSGSFNLKPEKKKKMVIGLQHNQGSVKLITNFFFFLSFWRREDDSMYMPGMQIERWEFATVACANFSE